MLKLFRYFAFCQKAWIKVNKFDCFLVFSCKCSLNFGSAKTSHWWISTPKNQMQCQQSKKRRSKVLAIKRQTFKSDVDLQVASSQMSSAGAVLARCCSQAATWCWRMIMVAMVKKPALFAFSAARLHQWKVLGIVYKKSALRVININKKPNLKLVIIRKDDDFDFSFWWLGTRVFISRHWGWKKWLKLSVIGRLTNEVRFAVAKLCFVSIKHQILTQCRALQNLSLHNDAISRKSS